MPGELKYRESKSLRFSIVNQFWNKEHNFQTSCFMKKSVKSLNQCESSPDRMVIRAGVIQTSYDIVKAHGGELSC